MVKKIGNFLICKLFTIYLILMLGIVFQIFSQELIFNALSRDGEILNNVAIGNRFILEVRLKNFSREDTIVISNLDQCFIKLLSNSRSHVAEIINNKRSEEIVYQYVAVANKIGVFELGPVVCGNVQSNVLKLNVVDFVKPIKSDNKAVNGSSEVEFVFNLQSNDQIFVGQTVPFMISISDNINPKNLIFPNSLSYKFSDIKKIEIKDQIGWLGKITFLDSKDISIMPIELEYDVSVRSDDFFSVFFGANFNRKREKIYSNKLDVFINPLPKTQSLEFENCAVGEFKDFNMSLDNNVVNADRATNLIVTIQSKDANLNLINYSLKNMPSDLKIYESSASVQEEFGWSIKKFEYVLQPTSDGEFIIPEQYFTYFDPIDKKYKKLKTDMLKLQVNPGVVKNNIVPEEVLKERDSVKFDFKNIILWQNYTIDWWIIIFLILIAIFIIFYQELFVVVLEVSTWINLFMNKYFINFYTRLRLIKAYKKLDSTDMILVIENYLGTKLNISSNFVFDFAEEKMLVLGISKEKTVLFSNFMSKLYNINFGFNSTVNKAKFRYFYNESVDWIKFFNKKLPVFLIACFYIFGLSANSEIENIVNLRRMQRGNTYSNFKKIEITVNAIKESTKIKPIDLYNKAYGLLYQIFGVVPLVIWQILLILYWWFFCLFVIIKRHLCIKSKLKLIIIGLILCIPVVFLNRLNALNYAVVKDEKALIFFGPGLDYPFISKANYLSDVCIFKVQGDWSQVGCNGNIGWIENSSIERI